MLKWLRANTLGTYLLTRLQGELVGEDDAGNRYYRSTSAQDWRAERRWVVYAGDDQVRRQSGPARLAGLAEPPARRSPPSEEPLPTKRWEKEHQPNLSGTRSPMCRPATSGAAASARRLRATTRRGGRDRRGGRAQAIALEVEQRLQHLGRLRAGDHVIVAEHADRHAGDARGARALVRLDDASAPLPVPAPRRSPRIRARARRRCEASTAARRCRPPSAKNA